MAPGGQRRRILDHHQTVSRTLKTEGIVLRKLRYGEADAILHIYTREFGRVGAIAKGVRRSKSRFGGRLEPFFRLELLFHEGRSELLTITSAETLAAHSQLRTQARSIESAAKIGDFVLRVLDEREQNLPAYNLIANALALLDASPEAAGDRIVLAFRAKLMLAAGFAPEIASCVHCGTDADIVAFSGAAGGIVCRDCRESADFDFEGSANEFLAGAIAAPLSATPPADGNALAQADRAIVETLAHHANVRVRTLA